MKSGRTEMNLSDLSGIVCLVNDDCQKTVDGV